MDEAQATKLREQLHRLPEKQAAFINYGFIHDTQQAIADAICQSIPGIKRAEFNYAPDNPVSFMPSYLTYILALAVEGQTLWHRRVVEDEAEDDDRARTRAMQLLAEATVKLAWHPYDKKLEGTLLQLLSGYASVARVDAQAWLYLVEITRLFIRHAANDLAHGQQPGETINDAMFAHFEDVFEGEDLPFFSLLKKAVGSALSQMLAVHDEAKKCNIALEVEQSDDLDDSQLMQLAARYVGLFYLWRKPVLLNFHPSGNASLGYYSDFTSAWKNSDYPIETAWVDSENILRVPFHVNANRSFDSGMMGLVAKTLGTAQKEGFLEHAGFKIDATTFAMM